MNGIDESSGFWDQLIALIEDERVVPVVGRDLLTVPSAGGQARLYQVLAERLADHLKVPSSALPEGRELDEVACRYLSQKDSSVTKIYTGLWDLRREVEALAIPKPLLQLAAIQPLRLFVTTTFDSLLTRALDQVRFGGAPNTSVLSYSPGKASYEKKGDLPGDEEGVRKTTVYHLLGKLSAIQNYAVTQWDLVEFFHVLQSETRGPKLLLGELSRQSLLILGSSMGGWLARFFVRIAKDAGGQTADYFADGMVSSDSNLVLFLQRFNRSVEIFPDGGPAEFVDELHRRWMERHPTSVTPLSAGPESPDAALTTSRAESGAVFLSYASEDRVPVEAIRDALEKSGVDVFFDKDDLRGGDLWRDKIRREIENCSLFIPVISRHTLTPGGRYFREEWTLANEEARQRPFSYSFVFPVIIDGTSQNQADTPLRFKDAQWQSLPGGEATPEFIALVQQSFRKYQKSRVVGME